MSTQTKSSCAASSSSAMSVVKVSRSALRCSSSARPGSWIVDLAARERLDLLGEDVARDDPVAELGEAGGGDQADPADPDHADRLSVSLIASPSPSSASGLGIITLRRARDPDHLVVGQGLQQAVGDPVGVVAPVPGDYRDAVAVEEDVVLAAVDRLGQARVGRGSAGPTSPGSPACRSSGCRLGAAARRPSGRRRGGCRRCP